MADVKAIAEELVNLTVKEVSELKTILKDEYGIEPAAAAVAVAAGPLLRKLLVSVLRRQRILLTVLLAMSRKVLTRLLLRQLRQPSRQLVLR